MSKVVLGMTISVDGFVNDREGCVDRLYSDFETLRQSATLQRTIRDTGAVVMGRKTFDMAQDPDSYAGNYEFQVPIFVVTHTPPPRHPKESAPLTFTFVTDGVERAILHAKDAAGARDVTVVGGAETARELIRAGLVDELTVDMMPVLLGDGLSFFNRMDTEPIELELIDVVQSAERVHLRWRVVGANTRAGA